MINKLQTLKEKPELAIFDEIIEVENKLQNITDVLKDINLKEIKTYEEELGSLKTSLTELKESFEGKDMVVNIPLDKLAEKLDKVETAIKNIKEVKIPKFPEFPKEMALDEVQINELLLAIQTIPEFPTSEMEKMFKSLEEKVEKIKLEVPESEGFDYDFLDSKFKELVKAVKNVSISVSGGGGGIGDRANNNLETISTNTSSIAGLSIPKHDYIVATYPSDTQEVYTYKIGGSAGTTVGTITVNYTTATKDVLSDVIKS